MNGDALELLAWWWYAGSSGGGGNASTDDGQGIPAMTLGLRLGL